MIFEKMELIQKKMLLEIDKHNASELNELIDECQNLTDTNCPWMMFKLKDIVIRAATSRLYWLNK